MRHKTALNSETLCEGCAESYTRRWAASKNGRIAVIRHKDESEQDLYIGYKLSAMAVVTSVFLHSITGGIVILSTADLLRAALI